jgi:L-amino acid N-acyltransferase YncA
MQVRRAVPTDAEAISAVYAHHVEHGVGTFEEDPPDRPEMARRMRTGHWLVAVDREQLLGYGYYGPYRPRSGYRFTVEDSVYVRADATGRGGRVAPAGRAGRPRAGGRMRVMVAAVGGSGNAASIRLHESHGFVRAGVLVGVGVKLGRTLDVVLLQRDLRAG